ncbi:Siderophore iron transporter [Lachnellula hyalina]|uniref:Siderophore iron transporter n=1 Tax=Lachnellula hyalina TaxID=1316788 RepID=A0A8H8R2K0_9HELO|nr:Siderophore iron transporter [Lachnellula hyalina]TVY27273.1 Siderophore iron transporter [Lachnellula hyalina]
MGFINSSRAPIEPSFELKDSPHTMDKDREEKSGSEVGELSKVNHADIEGGVARVEAAQAVWGTHGKYIIVAGELDNSTVYVYQNYATSSFDKLSLVSTLGTAGAIIFAVVKPPIAKLSNIIGRGETYIFTISCYLVAYILIASAKSFNAYAAGFVFYAIGQSGTNIMNDIIISDISTARWRGLAIGASFFPFIAMPWISAFIVDSVVHGIGWRWGIGMLAILMPFCASFIIATLLYYQSRAKKAGLVAQSRISAREFCSQIDLGGTVLFSCGFAMLLLPLTLAATTTSRWHTPYIAVLLALGCAFLMALPFYEKFVAKYPLVPVHYFTNPTIVMSMLLISTDSMGFGATHTYLYPWVTVVHDFAAREATFYTFTNGVTQCTSGIIAGFIMLKTQRYKWLLMGAVAIRLVGYGIMMRLRGANNTPAELFVVQLIQGIGSGVIQTAVLVSAQIMVPHAELAQITALVICFSFLGASIGASIAGGIYTGTFGEALKRHLGDEATRALIDELLNSITGVLPRWGSMERIAIDYAASTSSPPPLHLPPQLPPPKSSTYNQHTSNSN